MELKKVKPRICYCCGERVSAVHVDQYLKFRPGATRPDKIYDEYCPYCKTLQFGHVKKEEIWG